MTPVVLNIQLGPFSDTEMAPLDEVWVLVELVDLLHNPLLQLLQRPGPRAQVHPPFQERPEGKITHREIRGPWSPRMSPSVLLLGPHS